jgi:hypothetical protein
MCVCMCVYSCVGAESNVAGVLAEERRGGAEQKRPIKEQKRPIKGWRGGGIFYMYIYKYIRTYVHADIDKKRG